jgi:hypothetical protein
MDANLGHRFAGRKAEIAEHDLAVDGCGIIGRRYEGTADECKEQDDDTGAHVT